MISQESLPLVALGSMNDTHLEDLILINKLSEAIAQRDEALVTKLLDALLAHTVEHFSGEEAMMREKGFPPYAMHKGEHEKALGEMCMQRMLWNEWRDYRVLAHYIDDLLPDWIVQHIRTMDRVTADFLVHGISPCGSGQC